MIPLGTLASGRPPAAGLTLTHQGTWSVPSGTLSLNVPIGDASATRTVIAVVTWSSNVVRSIGSVTIGWNPTTSDVNDTTNRSGVAVLRATVPTGTTANVELSWNSNVASTVAVLTAPTALTVVDAAASPVASGASTSTITAATAAGGVVVVGAASGQYGTGLTVSPPGTIILAADRQSASIYDTTGTPLTITNTLTVASSDSNYNPFVAVAYAAS